MMKAITFAKYGSADNLLLSKLPKPTPEDGKVLVQVRAVALNAADRYALHGHPLIRFTFGLWTPTRQILGADVAGTIEAVGRGVTGFTPGQAVFGDLSEAGFGGLAEYVRAPAAVLAPMPANLSFAEAASVPMAAGTALRGLRAGGLRAGQHVLVEGASGGVGSYAIQIAKALGAMVTAVCSPSKQAWVRGLGADHVLDYTRDPLAGPGYDLILAVNGDRPLAELEPTLTPTGTLVVMGGSMARLFGTMAIAPFKSRPDGRKFHVLNAQPNQADLNTLCAWLEAGQIKPVLDVCYPLDQTPVAMREFEKGHARGKIVITLP